MDSFALNLTSVRERLGKSQKAVAERLGVSPSLVSKWEKGERKPDSSQIWELGRIFGVSPFFLQEANRVVNFQPRSQAARGAEDKHTLGTALNDAAQQIHHLYDVWNRADHVPARFPLALEFSEVDLPRLSRTVRDFFRLNDRISYGELREALTEHHVLVFEWKLPPKLSGLSYQRDFSAIFINEGMPEKVKLFTLCHELAHLLFHLRGEEDTAVSVMATRSDPLEKQANHFAAELLMPADRVTALVGRNRAELKRKAVFFAAVESFGVSHGAMFYRLTQAPWQVFSYTDKARLFTESAREATEAPGARVRKVPEQLPPPLLRHASQLWLAGKATAGKVAEWCMTARSAMDMHLATLADDSEFSVDDVDLGYAEVDGVTS